MYVVYVCVGGGGGGGGGGGDREGPGRMYVWSGEGVYRYGFGCEGIG